MSSSQSRKRPAADRLSDPPSPPQPEHISARHTPGNNKIPRRTPGESPTCFQLPDRHSPTPSTTPVQSPSQERIIGPFLAGDEHLPSPRPSGEQSIDAPLPDPWATSSLASLEARPWIVKLYMIHTTSSTPPTEFPDRFFQSVMAANSYARGKFDRQMRHYNRSDDHSHESSGPEATEIPLRLLGWSGDKHISCYVSHAGVQSASEDNVAESSTGNDRMEVEEGAHSTGDERVTDGSEGPGDETSSILASLID